MSVAESFCCRLWIGECHLPEFLQDHDGTKWVGMEILEIYGHIMGDIKWKVS